MTESTPTAVIAANVRAESSRRGISSLQLAAHLDLSQPAISRRMWGHVAFTGAELQAIAELLEMPIASLYGEVSA